MFGSEKVFLEHESVWRLQLLTPAELDDGAALQNLADGNIGVIVLRGFLSKKILSSAFTAIGEMEPLIKDNLYPNTRLITVGPYLAGSLDDPNSYFNRAKEIKLATPSRLTAFTADIYDLVASALRLDSLEVAQEGNGSVYSPFMVLIHRSGMAMPLHNDMIARDGVGSILKVATARSQLRCTVCVQECSVGGELILYKKRWSLADEYSKISGNFGYPPSLVDNVERLAFKPETGDVYLFNPTYYHEVAETEGDTRVTLGFFFGHVSDSDQDMVAWS